MWGSDQKSSIQPAELFHLMDQIKVCEKAIQYPPQERLQFEGENSKEKFKKETINELVGYYIKYNIFNLII